MATIGERVTGLESWRGSIDARLWGDGRTTSYERSLEGRMSAMESAWKEASALAEAARELRRTTGKRWSRSVQAIVAVSAIVTAVASVIAAWAAITALG